MRFGVARRHRTRIECVLLAADLEARAQDSVIKRMFRKILVGLVSMAGATLVIASPADDAISAFNRQEYVQATEAFRGLGQAGDPVAQYYMGLIFEKGLGFPANPSIAVQWYERAAEQGHADSQNNLGVMYLNGPAAIRNPQKALEWLEKAAGQGSLAAQMNLAYAYLNGVGLAIDYPKAIKWYGMAAQRDHAAAMNMLGVMHEKGQGVAPSITEARKWYDMAAKRGLPAAMYNLGLAHAMGRGVPQDYAKAYFWFLLAEQAGFEAAGSAVSFVGQYLNEKQKTSLRSKVDACQFQNNFKNCEMN